MPNVHELIRDHVTLSIRCLDRLYLHAYMPKLQTSGGLCYFLRDHLGHPIPSPALFAPMLDRFVAAIKAYATTQGVPLIAFERGQRKDDVVADVSRASAAGRGRRRDRRRAREDARVQGPQAIGPARAASRFDFSRQSVAVNHYYFYVQDPEWGPAFLKFGTYLPYPIKLCLNGHEWVKQQLRHADARLRESRQRVSSRAPIRRASRRSAIGSGRPTCRRSSIAGRRGCRAPVTAADRAAGYTHRLALQQVEVSLTQVFARPVQGRHFFEAVIRENLDLGRPDRVGLLFPLATDARRRRRRPGAIARASSPTASSRVCMSSTSPRTSSSTSKSSARCAPRRRSTIRRISTSRKAVPNLSHLRDLGDQVNRKLLEVERVSQQCVLTQDALDRLQQPTVERGQRVSALRFGDPRVMALFQAITAFTHLPRGFRNRDLRPPVAALLGRPYSAAQMTYDLRRLRLKGLIHRIPADASLHRDQLRAQGRVLLQQALSPHPPAAVAGLAPRDDQLPASAARRPRPTRAEIQKLHEEAALAA